MLIESIFNQSFAGVVRRPEAWAFATDNETFDPLGITVLPFTTTSFATLPSTFWPTLASLELTDWSSVTTMLLPAGTVPCAWSDTAAPAKMAATRSTTDSFRIAFTPVGESDPVAPVQQTWRLVRKARGV